jgi:hypothetical protein
LFVGLLALGRLDLFDTYDLLVDFLLQLGLQRLVVAKREQHLEEDEERRGEEGLEQRVQQRGFATFEDAMTRMNLMA